MTFKWVCIPCRYKLNEHQAMVVTTDFFMPIVDNPRHFGRIAAANAISDVYAMGGKPCLALSVLGMPINKLPTEVIQAGAAAVLGGWGCRGQGGGGGVRGSQQ